MNTMDKIDGLVAGITKAEIEGMEPALRQRLAKALRRVADLADLPKAGAPKEGLLHDLRDGRGAD